jgi:hypothetical protein
MTQSIDVTIEDRNGSRQTRIPVRRMLNLGSATRDVTAAIAHQDEVAHGGIHIAFDIPAPRIYPIGTHALSTASEVEVHGTESSGEVEIVLVLTDRLYVGVGSDHTDRALERTSIVWSKQTCANILAPTLWPWDAVAAEWDRFRLRAWVDGRLYQDVGTDQFLRPDYMLRIIAERAPGVPQQDLVVFGGTFVSLDKRLGFGARWDFSLEDPASGRAIRHGYDVTNLMLALDPAYRVPLLNPIGGTPR